ncbi:hypothetical protein N8352_07185 [Porticoccaceae bacterium]|nr:hypothetical protein [Porticoccaceae bacterium]
MNHFKASTLVISFATLLLLGGCGGGGNSNNAVVPGVEPTPILTGYFTDSAVEGLTYTTDTQSGVTDLNGAFTYQAGETVVFSIGDFVLGESAAATPKMTPLNLIPDAFLPTTRNELSPLLRNKKINTAEVIAFRKLSNMLTFLQALDYDKDASNGIAIADGMGIVLEGVSIDFSAELTEFKKTIPLRRVMSAAVTQNLISSGFIKEPGQALNHFYQAQEISHSFKAEATDSADNDANGEANEISTFTYDADGNLLTISYDANGFSSITTYTYDDNGNELTASNYSNGDGEADIIANSTYDDDGNRLTISVDFNSDGEPDQIITGTYDDDGNTLTRSVDFNGFSSITTYTYDDNGNRLTESYDYNGNGELDEISTFTYGDNGNQLTTSFDTDTNGEPNRIQTNAYDDDGNWLTFSDDTDANGEPNSIVTFTYDTDGNRLTDSLDFNADGDAEQIRTFTYDDDGNLLTESDDYNGNGELDEISTFTYDTDGNRLTYSLDNDADGEPNEITIYTYEDSSIAVNIMQFFAIVG